MGFIILYTINYKVYHNDILMFYEFKSLTFIVTIH